MTVAKLLVLAALVTTVNGGHANKAFPRDARMPRYEVILQLSREDCGLAVLANLGRAIGKPIDLRKLEANTRIPAGGMTFLGLRDLAKDSGVMITGVHAGPRGTTSQLPVPWIAHLSGRDWNHFVLVEAVRGASIQVVDPASGREVIPLTVFLGKWTGNALILEGRQ